MTPIQIQFGKPKTISPEIFIEFATFNPHIGEGGTRLGNLTKVDGVELYPTGVDPEKIYASLAFKWLSMGVNVSELPNPQLKDLKGEYKGLIHLECQCTHLPTGLIFKRSKWCWQEFTDENLEFTTPEQRAEFEVPNVPNPTGFLDVFEPWFPEYYVPYDNAYFDNDVNKDGKVTATPDLTHYLTNQ